MTAETAPTEPTTESATEQWLCAKCAVMFDVPRAGGFGLGPATAPNCPQCCQPAMPVPEGEGITCPQADDSPTTTQYSRGPQLFAGVVGGAVLAGLFAAIQLVAASLIGLGVPWLRVGVLALNGLFMVGWAFVNLAGLLKPG